MAEREIPVLVTMASLASYDGVPDDPIQVMTTGKLISRKKEMLLKYRENLEDETTGEISESEIQLILGRDQVTMNRMGPFSNTMMFQRNKRYETLFRTPYGDLPMAVHTRDIRCDLGRDAGKVHLKYEISMQGAYASTNELHLEYYAESAERAGAESAERAGAESAERAGAESTERAGAESAERAGAERAERAGAERAENGLAGEADRPEGPEAPKSAGGQKGKNGV